MRRSLPSRWARRRDRRSNNSQFGGKCIMETDFVFPHSYKIEALPDLPGTGKFDVPVLYFPEPTNRPEHNGLWLWITPLVGQPWIGVFAFLFDSPHNFSRVLSTPDPDCVCVVSGSAGYIVRVDSPEIWEEIVIPVLTVTSLPEHRFLLFGDFTSLLPTGGMAWPGVVPGFVGTS
jgi:hypothetical protein